MSHSYHYSTQRRNKRIKRILGGQAHRWAFCPDRLSYITPVYLSQKVAQEICQIYPNAERVWDMFGGIGTDAIHLAPYFEKIYVTEIDLATFQCLCRNLQTFHKKNITAIKMDCTLPLKPPITAPATPQPQPQIDVSNIDLVYFDPPWGDSYVANQPFDFSSVRLGNGVKVIALLMEILQKVSGNIVVKSPIKCQTFEILLGDRITKVLTYPEYKLKFILARSGPIPQQQTSSVDTNIS